MNTKFLLVLIVSVSESFVWIIFKSRRVVGKWNLNLMRCCRNQKKENAFVSEASPFPSYAKAQLAEKSSKCPYFLFEVPLIFFFQVPVIFQDAGI